MADNEEKKPLKVLLVEDVDMFMAIASELLKGHEVKFASSASSAISAYKSNNPDITLLDIKLPDGSGHDVLKEIKSINKNAFVIMVTASRNQEDVDMAVNNGADGYIIKPFSFENIQEAIKSFYTKVNSSSNK